MPPGAPATACVPRLAFGNGVIYWEYFYGARSWLVPGVVAGVLKLFDLVGLGQPWWYVGAVKLLFCALSLAVPAAMYWTGRRHFGEAAARMALLAGSFWYELVAFAHKPMTEFVATAPLLALLPLCLRREWRQRRQQLARLQHAGRDQPLHPPQMPPNGAPR